jgi:hypothetical protein
MMTVGLYAFTTSIALLAMKRAANGADTSQMLLLLINGTLTDVSQQEGVTPDAMLGVIDRWIEAEVDWSAIPPFAVFKGGQNVCVVWRFSALRRAK